MTAKKITQQLISTVKLSLLCQELIDAKHASLLQTQPVFRLFNFGHKANHPYTDLKLSAVHAHKQLMRLTKGVAGWDINSQTIANELDVIKAQHVVNGVGTDIDVVDEMRGWTKRNINAQVAADNMEQAFRHATVLWSNASPKAVRDNIKNYMGSMKMKNCIEKPEIELVSHCKQLVTAIKKLNKHLRDVVRGNSSMMNCYSKRQVMNTLSRQGADTVLTILIK